MTHPAYLEQYHAITSKVLPDVAIRLAKGDHDGASDLFTRLTAKLDALWAQRLAETAREVAP